MLLVNVQLIKGVFTPNRKKLASCVAQAAIVAVGFGIATERPAQAGALLGSPVRSTCGTINCGSNRVAGAYILDQFGQNVPWEAQFYTTPNAGGECLRLDVISEDQDLEMVVISPDGGVLRNDDRNGSADRRPLVVATSGKVGWQTVQISQFAGAGPSSNFILSYGRYALGNVNCANPTVPFLGGAARK